MHLGAHVSITGGLYKSLDRIVDLGGNTLMTFASSPRSLRTNKHMANEIQKYLQKKAELNLGPHFFHGVYLINLASDSKSLLKAGIDSLIYYQQLAGEIGAVGTIFHIGSHKGQGLAETLNQIVAAINYILDSSPKGTRLILENAAGQAGTIGQTFEELSQIISRVGDKPKIGVCLDTQHAFASGYPLDSVLDKFDRAINLKHLSVIHLNDSLTDFNSHIDRHANLGKGKIGLDTIRKFLSDPRLKNIPVILETPGENNSGPRKQDIALLKSLVVQ
jgi:deoxyribonuclease-4